ncbi:MAG: ABC transporter permease [Synergistaceae bacterium]|jgi:peptide/nickel transport system permease protein|nr:ABC transporter permease [Synergistaceae bacterium]
MCLYLIRRFFQAFVSIVGISTIVFFALHLSGDPVRLMVPPDATLKDMDILRHELGLDRPLYIQYVEFFENLSRGDLGHSYVQNRPVLDIIRERFPYTVRLALAALLISVVTGIFIGIVNAVFRGKWIEKMFVPFILIGQCLPAFCVGILLIMLFSVQLRWLPSTGARGLKSLILPSITLASLSIASLAQVTRANMLEQLEQNYVRTARAKGAGTPRIVIWHVIRNAGIPIITLVGLETANLLGGAVVTETIFAWPGLGLLTIQAINARDFPLVQAIVLFVSIIFIAVNFLTDLLYVIVDPRIKLEKESA